MTLRRWLRIIGKIAVLAGCAAAVVYGSVLYGTYVDPALRIRHLTIEGVAEGGASAREVQESVEGALAGANFFLVRLDRVKSALEDISWVKSASVDRVWPNGMKIALTRYEPVAVWDDGRLVSEEGVLFSSSEIGIDRLSALPSFSADPASAPMMVQVWRQLSDRAQGIGLRVKSVNVSVLGSWRVMLESAESPDITVELGRAKVRAVLLHRFGLVVDYFHKISDMMQGYPVYVDARYSNAFSVRLPDQDNRTRWEIAKGIVKPGEAEQEAEAGPEAPMGASGRDASVRTEKKSKKNK